MTYIIKMADAQGTPWWFLWSSNVDSPVSEAMTLEELKAYYMEEYGRSGMQELDERLKRVEANGHSCRYKSTVKELIEPCNRAGKDETWLTVDQQLELVIKWRTDPDYQIMGVSRDMICCMCSKPIANEKDRTFSATDIDKEDPMHLSCAPVAKRS